MSDPDQRDLSTFSLLDLFRSEASSQAQALADGLLGLERAPDDPQLLQQLMRSAHSIKGAAAIVDLPLVVTLAHRMEDVFVAAREQHLQLDRAAIDTLLKTVDLLAQIAQLADTAAAAWFATHSQAIEENAAAIAAITTASTLAPAGDAAVNAYPPPAAATPTAVSTAAVPPAAGLPRIPAMPAISGSATAPSQRSAALKATPRASPHDQSIKVGVEHLDRLLALTSESLVSTHVLHPLVESLQRFKKKQDELFGLIGDLHQTLVTTRATDLVQQKSLAILHAAAPLKQLMVQQVADLEAHERTLLSSSQTTVDEVLALRMRPLKDALRGLPRMVRDLAHSLGKEARLEIIGENTPVDRDILSRIESPLNHLLRNAVDHGIEMPEQRLAAGKPREGTVRITARHAAGMVHIEVSDDGRGVDLEGIRGKTVERKMATEAMAAAMSTAELLEFLFLPAFTLKESASIVSGRGVGLDIVQEAIRQQFGTIHLENEPGRGLRTVIVLPLTQSVVRSLVAQIGGEAYAFPIAKIERVITVAEHAVHILEDKPFFTLDGEHIGLVEAAQVLELPIERAAGTALHVLLVGSSNRRYGLVVDAIVGEYSLAVQVLEPSFGKMRDIAAGALLENGLPVLILDMADLLLSIEKMLVEGSLQSLQSTTPGATRGDAVRIKRILVVDDSLTVREMERNLLLGYGFEVDVAVDGSDGWNAVRSKPYDLLITDVDMPRMDGIELVALVKKDLRLQSLPVMIVSYKDRPEDRARGIEAGADYYLTKGSFHDATLIDAVIDLIGEGSA